jgi:hypothetical protein
MRSCTPTRWAVALGAVLFGIAVSTAAAAAPSQCEHIAGNLVANCGFETVDITHSDVAAPRVGGWNDINTGVGAGIGPGELTGGGANHGGLTHSGVNSYNAFFQNLPVVLIPELDQAIETTIGHTYQVDFFENMAGPQDAQVIVFAQIDPPQGQVSGGANLGTQMISLADFAGGYHHIIARFVADQTLSVLDFNVFAFRPHQETAQVAFNFDDVSVVDVTAASGAPEPAAWSLMIAGFGLAGAALRRRARRPAFGQGA